MSFSYPVVAIGSTDYETYSTTDNANTYLNASINSAAESWRAADSDTKSRALVSATRWLDSVTWSGVKTDTTQDLAWPRATITDVDSTELPSQLVAACIELAAYLADNADGRADLSSPLIKSQKAGSVMLDYFRPEGGTQVQTPFPQTAMALISQWLGGAGAPVGSISTGTCEKSHILNDQYGFQHGV